MGLFFKGRIEEPKVTNSYLEDQNSVFNTEGEVEKKVFNDNYDEFVYKPKDYSTIPKYHASDNKKVDVVVDKDELGYQGLNPDIKTVNVQKKNLHDDLQELVDNGYIDDSSNVGNTSIYDEGIKDIIKKEEQVEILEIDDSPNMMVSNVVEEDLDKSKKLSIFGNSDEPIQAKVYEVKEAPKLEKIEIVEPVIEEVKVETPRPEYCPQCGAPVSKHATTCFLCGKEIENYTFKK